MENLQQVEVVKNDVIYPITPINYELVQLELLRIQDEVNQDFLQQRSDFFFGNMRSLLTSLAIYGVFVLIAWAKYKK